MSVVFGVMLLGMFCHGASDSYNVVTSEETFTIAEGSTPTIDPKALSFSYVENGEVKNWYAPVEDTKIPIKDTKEIKITHRDAVDPRIAPWVLGDAYKAEFK